VSEAWRTLKLADWQERRPIPARRCTTSRRIAPGAAGWPPDHRGGDRRGLRIAHLQCHPGDDSVAPARRGAASVPGMDLSPSAIAAARAGH
jgi:hypothetical protein